MTVAVVTAGAGFSMVVGVTDAGATNSVGPGDGVDGGGHNSGAYSITTTNGQLLAYCITPGLASPTEIPNDVFTPLAAAPDGGLAYLGYFAATFQGGIDGYDTNDVNAAVAYIAYGTGLGTAPAALVSLIEADMAAYPGPWTLTVTPPSGANYSVGTTYTGDVTVTAANGDGVPGLAISTPAIGGAGQWSSFAWAPNVPTDVTDADGHLPFTFVQSSAGGFTESFSVVGGVPGSAPVEYAPPAGSGGQTMLAAVASAGLSAALSGTVTYATAAVEVTKSDNDPAYVPLPAGVTFNVVNSTGAVADQLTTAAGGLAGPSPANLGVGSYTIVETAVPAGSGLVLNPTPVPFQITAGDIGGTVPVTVDVAVTDAVVPGTLIITKTDSDTKVGLGGAQFTVAFDSAGNGTFATPVNGPNPNGSFTSGTNGMVIDPAGALASLLPGNYRVTETVAPPGHVIPTPPYQDVTIPVGGGTEALTFADQTVPTISTSATSASQVGATITDTATLTASAHATGTITFAAYGPFPPTSTATCTAATLAFTSAPVTVAGSGTYPMAGGYTPTATGLYEWIESYSGDTNNIPVAGSCGASGESTVVVQVATTATAQASGTVPIADTVTVTGPLPAGSLITSTLYRSTDTSCATPLWTTPAVTSGSPTASATNTATNYLLDGITEPAGAYQWVETVTLASGTTVATGSCNAALESSTVLASIPAATQSPISATPASVTG